MQGAMSPVDLALPRPPLGLHLLRALRAVCDAVIPLPNDILLQEGAEDASVLDSFAEDLKREIGKMRHMAEVNALPCVSDLAYGLEHLLAHGWSRTMAAQYLDAMDEAISSDCGDGDMRAAMLASSAVRGVR